MKWVIAVILLMFFTACESLPATQEVDATPTEQEILTPSETPLSQQGCKKIAMVLTDGANSDIYTICPDGSELVISLTNGLQILTPPGHQMASALHLPRCAQAMPAIFTSWMLMENFPSA